MKDKTETNRTRTTAASDRKEYGMNGGTGNSFSKFDEKTVFAPGGDLDALELSPEDIVESPDETISIRDAKTVVIPEAGEENAHRLISETAESIPYGRFVDSAKSDDPTPLLTPDPASSTTGKNPSEIPEFEIPFLDRDQVTIIDPIPDADGPFTEGGASDRDAMAVEANEASLFGRDVSTVIAPIPEEDEDAPETLPEAEEADSEEDLILDLDDAMIVEPARPANLRRNDGPEDTILDLGGRTLYKPKTDAPDAASNDPEEAGDEDESIIELGTEAVFVPEAPEGPAPPVEAETEAAMDRNADTMLAEPSFFDPLPPAVDDEEDILDLDPLPEPEPDADSESTDPRPDQPEEDLFRAEGDDGLSEKEVARRAEESFPTNPGLTALDLFADFSDPEGEGDFIDPIGLIDVLGADTGPASIENDFLSRLESGFQAADEPEDPKDAPPEVAEKKPNSDLAPTENNAAASEKSEPFHEDAVEIFAVENGAPVGTEGVEPTSFSASEPDPEQIASITSHQLEAALERVIHRVFTERIEKILREVIEKTVSEEIHTLRGVLLENIAIDTEQ